jgi:hypothetical protein
VMPRSDQIGKAHRDKSRFLVGSEVQNIFGFIFAPGDLG